jgi:DOPA 4,5-dioxygenase
MNAAPLSRIRSYHAHIYFDPGTRSRAEALREQIAVRFSVQLGRWREAPVGPHSAAMYQVAFAPEVFAAFVPWLMLNRQGLDVLVHPNTGAPRDDHLVHALWLGRPLPLGDSVLPLRSEREDPVVPNTEPTLKP